MRARLSSAGSAGIEVRRKSTRRFGMDRLGHGGLHRESGDMVNLGSGAAHEFAPAIPGLWREDDFCLWRSRCDIRGIKTPRE